MDESQVIFHGPDRRARGWILSDSDVPVTKRKRQRGNNVMIWAGIVDQTTTVVNKGVNVNSANDCYFMDKTFFAWYKSPSSSFKGECVYMLHNAISHASKLSCEFFEHKRFIGAKMIEGSPPSLDLNPIKNLW